MASAAYIASFFDNIYIALLLFILIWIFSWAKGALGSPKLAILFALIIVYLTVYQFPELVWIGVGLFLFATFGKDLLANVNFHQGRR